jgi:hypothetical protein
MKLKTNTVVYSVLEAILLFYVLWAVFDVPALESKLLPIAIGGATLALSTIGLARAIRGEFKQRKEAPAKIATQEKRKDEGEQEPWRGSLINFGWVVGFLLGIYLLGYVIAIFVFALAYMKRLGTRWRTAAIGAVLVTALIYVGFELGLQLPLYRGLFLEMLGY